MGVRRRGAQAEDTRPRETKSRSIADAHYAAVVQDGGRCHIGDQARVTADTAGAATPHRFCRPVLAPSRSPDRHTSRCLRSSLMDSHVPLYKRTAHRRGRVNRLRREAHKEHITNDAGWSACTVLPHRRCDDLIRRDTAP